MYIALILVLLVSSADNLCKQFRPRSGPTKCRAWSGSKLFETLMEHLKEFFKKVDFEKNRQTTNRHEKLPRRQSALILILLDIIYWYPGLKLRVRNENLIFLFLNQNICCGYSKEPSQWDGSFERPKHMLKLRGKKIFTILRRKYLFI